MRVLARGPAGTRIESTAGERATTETFQLSARIACDR